MRSRGNRLENRQEYRTLEGLNAERCNAQWYWRLLAYIASWLILGGFEILPATFNDDIRLRTTKAVLGIFAVALLTAGFSLTALVCFACRSSIFQVDCVFLPALTSCAIGLLTVFYNFIVSQSYGWNVAALLTTIGAAVSTVIYGALFTIFQRKIALSRTTPNPINLTQLPSVTSAAPSYHDPSYFSNHLANMYPAARSTANIPSAIGSPLTDPHPNPPPEDLTEEDLLRQQMLMLLLNKPDPSSTRYPDPAASSFNRIDFTPADEIDVERGTPAANDFHQPPPNGYYAPVADTTAFSSPPSSTAYTGAAGSAFGTGAGTGTNRTPRAGFRQDLQPWDGVWRTPPDRGTLETAVLREQRRREIEMGR